VQFCAAGSLVGSGMERFIVALSLVVGVVVVDEGDYSSGWFGGGICCVLNGCSVFRSELGGCKSNSIASCLLMALAVGRRRRAVWPRCVIEIQARRLVVQVAVRHQEHKTEPATRRRKRQNTVIPASITAPSSSSHKTPMSKPPTNKESHSCLPPKTPPPAESHPRKHSSALR